MLHETLPGCINTGVRIISKLDENFLIIKIPLGKKKKKKDRKNGRMGPKMLHVVCICAVAFLDMQLPPTSD